MTSVNVPLPYYSCLQMLERGETNSKSWFWDRNWNQVCSLQKEFFQCFQRLCFTMKIVRAFFRRCHTYFEFIHQILLQLLYFYRYLIVFSLYWFSFLIDRVLILGLKSTFSTFLFFIFLLTFSNVLPCRNSLNFWLYFAGLDFIDRKEECLHRQKKSYE